MVTPPSTDAASLKPLRAYIAAPADIDTTTLRRLLSDQNVAVDDAYSPSVGGPLTDTILKSIRSADCAVAIITQDSWTAYEVGLCDAFGKPVLVLATP